MTCRLAGRAPACAGSPRVAGPVCVCAGSWPAGLCGGGSGAFVCALLLPACALQHRGSAARRAARAALPRSLQPARTPLGQGERVMMGHARERLRGCSSRDTDRPDSFTPQASSATPRSSFIPSCSPIAVPPTRTQVAPRARVRNVDPCDPSAACTHGVFSCGRLVHPPAAGFRTTFAPCVRADECQSTRRPMGQGAGRRKCVHTNTSHLAAGACLLRCSLGRHEQASRSPCGLQARTGLKSRQPRAGASMPWAKRCCDFARIVQ